VGDPYLLCDEVSLRQLSTRATGGRYFRLTQDITLNGPWTVVPVFTGFFDGAGHTITGLTVTAAGNVGMFGDLITSHVHDLRLAAANVTGTTAGLLAGRLVGGLTEDVDVRGTVLSNGPTDSAAGGLVGQMEAGTVTRIHVLAGVTGPEAGGLVGRIQPMSSVTVSEVMVSGSVQGSQVAGGIVGQVVFGAEVPAFSHLRVDASVATAASRGGLAGDCGSGTWATGLVTGNVGAGGSAVASGGFGCTFQGVFWDLDTVGPTDDLFPGTTALTTLQAQNPSSYPPAFSVTIWVLASNAYPALANISP
jgi:hypothetical protein